ncbi:hypothetical protein CR203_07715 [Salipaludibacillus neizhouensis]|uniref:Heme-degrading domain-containing protein n=1 Tax=Salipaludibacillus neizhouensis TaxID=885475 RepID=A0A3A9K9W2_9BACI|nr:heme-binding protein [Salipaludibacillus neizhouensis]RKL68358.1 hypothetical protein CR203_07715 [Salipaludibacillus neizhouensis]
MNNSKDNYEELAIQEKNLEFERFSRNDALAIGLTINEKAKKFSDPITIEITLNGLVIFRYFSEGAVLDSELWLVRKRNSVNLMSMSSLRFKYWLEVAGKTLEGRNLNASDYAAGGGGFPINLKGTGLVGSICVSGLANHLDDHQLIVDAISEFLN